MMLSMNSSNGETEASSPLFVEPTRLSEETTELRDSLTSDDPFIQELATYGYSELESRFLRLVALHSGVFLARHFDQFAGTKRGKRVDAFLDKLRKHRHCHSYKLAKNANLFHLNSKAIYRSIGHENLRHRRTHGAQYVKTRLFSLDFVLANPTFNYLTTEPEKVEFFTQVMKVPVSHLPAKVYKTPNSKEETVRYFVDKFPLFLSNLSSSPPVVHFTYVDPGPITGVADFLNHLRTYGSLFSRMNEVRLVYIYHSSSKWRRAHDLFSAFVRSGYRVKINDGQMVKYFQIRSAWEAKQYEKVGP